MSSTIIKDEQKFKENYEQFESSLIKIKDIFEKQNNEFNSINETEIWTSDTQKDMIVKYNELKDCYEPIEDSLNNFINFMKKVLSDYQRLNNQGVRETNYNKDNLDVN